MADDHFHSLFGVHANLGHAFDPHAPKRHHGDAMFLKTIQIV